MGNWGWGTADTLALSLAPDPRRSNTSPSRIRSISTIRNASATWAWAPARNQSRTPNAAFWPCSSPWPSWTWRAWACDVASRCTDTTPASSPFFDKRTSICRDASSACRWSRRWAGRRGRRCRISWILRSLEVWWAAAGKPCSSLRFSPVSSRWNRGPRF